MKSDFDRLVFSSTWLANSHLLQMVLLLFLFQNALYLFHSPIMEGSNEESNSHGSTMGGSHAGTGFRSVVSHAAHSMQSVSEHCEPQTLFTDLSPEIRQPPQMEMDMLKVAGMDMNRSAHNIDTSTYVPEEVENDPLSMSVYINPSDPFDEETINQFLRTLSEPLDTYPNYISVSEEVPCINEGHILYLGL